MLVEGKRTKFTVLAGDGSVWVLWSGLVGCFWIFFLGGGKFRLEICVGGWSHLLDGFRRLEVVWGGCLI